MTKFWERTPVADLQAEHRRRTQAAIFALGMNAAAASTGPAVDPYAADVVLLMRMEGADAGTTFTDSSPLLNPIDRTSGFTTSTDRAKSGTTSCKCTAAGGHLAVTGTASTALPGNFTAETWAYWAATPIGVSCLFRFNSGTLAPYHGSDGKLVLTEAASDITGTTTVTLNAWHHIAVTRTGTTIRMWLDGVQEGGTYTSSTSFFGSGSAYIGSISDGGGMMGNGTLPAYLDLLRITKGVDRYGTVSFTPPADY